ncbi:Octanoyltransferase [Penicillium hispanicum]|uniref:Octanoyltransferase n=1 Tax=Penicillium hispanicum TaxID=1080232 RepID=UPI002541E8E2|nr:Octanoyltransferase [Penicillium hispanicum]KAJ5594281.1 Octanoyltransferase [Penicillium hispanicum]
MRLAHLHLPNTTPFARVSDLQQALTTRFLTHKKLASPASISSQDAGHLPRNAHPPPPDPTIITFSPNPVYTTGRRDLPPSNTCPPSATTNLSLPPALEPIRSLLTPSGPNAPKAEYHPTLRGGQTTYHGPGQMVAYTILDLKRLGLTPRCHIRVLENSVIDLLRRYGVKGIVTEDPGVWVQDASAGTDAPPKKITAVGVHLRRNISSFGVGLNVTQEPMWFFRQIVACGLEGKEATSLEGVGVHGIGVDEVARGFVDCFVSRVNEDFACGDGATGEKIEEVYSVREKDLLQP